MGPLLILILLFVVMYAVMIRPQQKRARDHQALVAAVQVGDEVMTTAGIFGTVTAVEGDVVSIEISPGTVMRVARAGIGRRLNAELEEFEAGESFDDIDDELEESVADEPTPTHDLSAPPAPPPPPAAPPVAPPAPPAAPPTMPPSPPTSEAPPVTPPAPETPPAQGPGPGSTEPG
jgi:preprotein translocase subunit YajC